MNMHDINAQLPGIAAAALALVGLWVALTVCVCLRRWQKRCVSLEASLATLRRDLDSTVSVQARTALRLERIAREFAKMAGRVELFESRGRGGSFDQAIDWARRGADPHRLSQHFGLSESEAELVIRLHGRKKRA
jgi:hypothetical protein